MGHLVVSGLELLAKTPSLVRGRRFAVLANQAAVTCDLVPAWHALSNVGGRLVRLFAPEHGLWGLAEDMETVAGGKEAALGLEIRSLYGATSNTLSPRPEDLEDLDVVVVDLPDIGCRYYTFAATLAHTMEACEAAGVEVIVCDRPNPLNGVTLEGGAVETGFRSFVSELPVPVRHGMTLGELALLLAARRTRELSLTVLQCRGWRRPAWGDETGLPWVAPSPNMPSLETVILYPGACLVEATNLSEGRGTTRPFKLIGAPWLDGVGLAKTLNALDLPGCRFRPTYFRPAFQKHAGEICGGIEWHVTDRGVFRPFEVGVRLVSEARRANPMRFAWRGDGYEFVADTPAIDLLTGSSRVREAIGLGGAIDDLVLEWESYCRSFAAERREFLLYGGDET